MEAQGSGAIVNLSSVAGMRFIDRPLASYQAAKAGLVQFSRALGVEYAPNSPLTKSALDTSGLV